MLLVMGLPQEPVVLTAEQVADLNQKLSRMRHNVNNHLSLIVAASEMIRFKPEMAQQMNSTVSDQPTKIMDELRAFSAEFEKRLNITKT